MLPSGRFKPETYAFGKGTIIDKSEDDKSLAKLSFEEIASILAEALKAADYIPTPSPEETDILILVSWGKTTPHDGGLDQMALFGMEEPLNSTMRIQKAMQDRTPPGGQPTATPEERSILSSTAMEMTQMFIMQEMEQRARDQANAYNARLLGYTPELYFTHNILGRDGPLRVYRNDLMDELESPRYFVVLQAYDFPKMWKEKKSELLWTTRLSIRAKGRSFDENLWSMAMASSRVFGTKTDRLKRNLKPARVEFGELEYLGEEKE